MNKFSYTAKNSENKIINGIIDAQSVAEASVVLEKSGLTVLNISLETDTDFNKTDKSTGHNTLNDIPPLSSKQKLDFFNSFYYLYSSGYSVLETFQSMFKSSSDKVIKSLCNKIVNSVKKGNSLEVSFRNYSHCLGIAYTSLVVTGEKSGKLEVILDEIITNLERELDFKNKLAASITYPCFILVLAFTAFLFAKFFLLKIFTSYDNPLSSAEITNLLFMSVFKILIIFLFLLFAGFFIFKNKKILANIIDFISKLPIFSSLIKKYDFMNFFAVSSLAYNAGIPANEVVSLALSVVSLNSLIRPIKRSCKLISQGCDVTTAFAAANVFSSFDMSQISAGEKSGELDKMFKIVSENYEKQFENSMKIIVRLIEPVMIIFAGVIVGYICYTAYQSYFNYLFNII